MLIALTYTNVKVINMSGEQKRCDTYHHGDLKRTLTGAALGLVAEKGPKGFMLTEAAGAPTCSARAARRSARRPRDRQHTARHHARPAGATTWRRAIQGPRSSNHRLTDEQNPPDAFAAEAIG